MPAALPALASGLRVAAAVAPIGAVIGEWVGSSAGLGYLMLHANARMQVDLMFAALLVLAAMALLLWLAVDRGGRALVPWQPEAVAHDSHRRCLMRPARVCCWRSRSRCSLPPALAADKLTVHARLVRQSRPRPADHRPRAAASSPPQGLDVELIAPADPNDPPKLVAAGKADIAVSYQPQLHLQVDAGPAAGPRSARWWRRRSTAWSCWPTARCKSIADLKGRKVGFSVGGFEDALLRRHAGASTAWRWPTSSWSTSTSRCRLP